MRDYNYLKEFNKRDKLFIFLGFTTVRSFQLIFILGVIGCIFLLGWLIFFQPLMLSNSSYPLGFTLAIGLYILLHLGDEVFFSMNLWGYKKIGKEAFLYISSFLITLPGVIIILSPEGFKRDIDLSWLVSTIITIFSPGCCYFFLRRCLCKRGGGYI